MVLRIFQLYHSILRICALVDFSFYYAHLAHFQLHPSIMRVWALFSVIHSILRFCALFSFIFLTCAKWAGLSGNWNLAGPIGYVYVFAQIPGQTAPFCA
jgi:hypothetical protein